MRGRANELLRLIPAAMVIVVFGVWVMPLAFAAEPWVAHGQDARKQNPVAADEKSVARGKALYLQACIPCHGTKGKGDGSAAAALDPKPADHTSPKMWEETDGTLFWKISTGRGAMPTFEEAYSAEDRWHLVNYLRTLAPKESDASTPTKGGKP